MIFPIFLVFLLPACASQQVKIGDWLDPDINAIWPEPPAQPRIQLLRVVSGATDLYNEEEKGGFFSWLLGKPIDEALLVSPYGIVADGRGRIWVADPGSNAVRLYSLSKRGVESIDQAEGVGLESPVGVAYDQNKEIVYVSDSSRRKVFLFSVSGGYLGKLAPPGDFERPAGLAVDKEGSLYVVDVTRGVIDLFDRNGTYLRSIGSASAANGLFNHPSNVAVDSAGRVYVVDSLRFRVEVQDADGKLIGLVGQLGDAAGTFSRPRGVGIDSDGHIYVVDAAFDNIQIFDLTGRLLLAVGGPGDAPGELCLPAGLYIDNADRIYVTEACNHRFQVMQYLDVLGE